MPETKHGLPRIGIRDLRTRYQPKISGGTMIRTLPPWLSSLSSTAVTMLFSNSTAVRLFSTLGDVAKLAVGLAGGWIDRGDVVFHFLVVDEFPAAGLAFVGLAEGGFGGFAVGEGDFVKRHADGDLFGIDEGLHLDLAFVELFEVRDEFRVGGGKRPWRDPAGDAVAGSLAADAVDFVGDGLEADGLVGLEGAEAVFAFLVGKNRGFLDDLELDRFLQGLFQIDHVGIGIEQRLALAALDFGAERAGPGRRR